MDRFTQAEIDARAANTRRADLADAIDIIAALDDTDIIGDPPADLFTTARAA